MADMIERVARAIAKRNGDDYDLVPLHKIDWTQHRGMFGGRYRDVNEPYRTDYDEMAEAALGAMKIPDAAEGVPGGIAFEDAFFGGHDTVFHAMAKAWNATIDAALSPSPSR